MPDQAARLFELPAIIASLGHRQRNAMRGEDDLGGGASALDVFQVLPAPGIRTEYGRHEAQGAPHTVGSHFPQRVGERRMPVTISPVDRKRRAIAREFALQTSDQRAVLIVDRTLAAEMIIM